MKMQHAMFLFMCSSIAVADVLNTTPSTKKHIPAVNEIIENMYDPEEIRNQITVEYKNFKRLLGHLRKLQDQFSTVPRPENSHIQDTSETDCKGSSGIDTDLLNEMKADLEQQSRPVPLVVSHRWGEEGRCCDYNTIDVELANAQENFMPGKQNEVMPVTKNHQELQDDIDKVRKKIRNQILDLEKLKKRLDEIQ